jgi:enoyl-CoA hydratase/carnithine racemase
MSEPVVLVERRGHVLIATLNRPDALNAIDAHLALALGSTLVEADADPEVRVVVITGAGRAFCAGMDLKAYLAGVPAMAEGHPEWGLGGISELAIGTPVIAAVNGVARGLGGEVALAADLLVMDENASIGMPEVALGLLAAAGGAVRLPQQLPEKIALEMLLTGEPISAARAAELGLANRVAPAGTALEVALELAERIAKNAPGAVAATKRLVHREGHRSTWTGESWPEIRRVEHEVFGGAEAREGATAFTEKRPPVWP